MTKPIEPNSDDAELENTPGRRLRRLIEASQQAEEEARRQAEELAGQATEEPVSQDAGEPTSQAADGAPIQQAEASSGQVEDVSPAEADALPQEPSEEAVNASLGDSAENTAAEGEPPANSATEDDFIPPLPEKHPVDLDAPTIPPLPPEPPVSLEDTSPHAVKTEPVDPVLNTPFDDRAIPAPSDATPPARHPLPSQPPVVFTNDQANLPRRVDEVDPDSTQVTPSAYQHPGTTTTTSSSNTQPTRPVQSRPPVTPPQPRPPTRAEEAQRRHLLEVQRAAQQSAAAPRPAAVPPRQAARKGNGEGTGSGWRTGLGCLLRMFLVMAIVVIVIFGAGATYAVIQYFTIARTLPDISGLSERASQFETTRILDRNGNVLYEILDPNAGRRTYVPLERISPYVLAATIATEDKEYYNHPGFDPIAIARAFWANYTTGEIVSGASTITQQLARMLLLDPQEASQRTYERKAREIVLAAELTRRYSKDDILELFLNENNYGNLAYGIEAAAETYFNTSAEQLNLAQAAFLAGLPQAPAVHDIYSNRDETLRRHKQVLVLMYQLSQEKNCIEVSNSIQPVCVDAQSATQAAQEIEAYNFQQPRISYRYPHWVNYIRTLLEAQYDAQTIYRSGFTVTTTLDPALQDEAQDIVRRQIDSLAGQNVQNGALVAMKPSTGEILAMVGSADFDNDAIAGQINMSVVPRQPGSSIKPLTYLTAFEKGWTPATLIWDVPSEFPPSGDPNDTREPYRPVNYDGRFHGPITLRSALANSYNVPAVKALQYVGIYNGLIPMAQRMGISTLTRNDYGLSLTLGGGEVTLVDMTNAFATLANNGRRIPPVAITKIVDYTGKVIFEHQSPSGEQVVRPEHAYLITSILSDAEARAPAFGRNSVLELPFPAAAKTGTTNDVRDNWTMGYTPDLAVGVWVGNADYTPMQGTSGITGAAPIWAEFMQRAVPALTGGNPSPFVRPANIVERVVCSLSGTEPSEWCPSQRSELFAADQQPPSKDNDLWKKVNIDTWTGLRASPACSNFTAEKFALNVNDPTAIKWIRETDQGREWASSIGFNDPIYFAPDRECKAEDPHPNVYFAGLSEDQVIMTNPLDIYAVVDAPDDFRRFRLEWGLGDDPSEWKTLLEGVTSPVRQPDRIYTWNLNEVPREKITLRIYLESTEDHYAEKRIHLKIEAPTPTPTPTNTSTPTPTPTLTPTPTVTPSITPTPSPTVVPPTETPSPTPSPTAGA